MAMACLTAPISRLFWVNGVCHLGLDHCTEKTSCEMGLLMARILPNYWVAGVESDSHALAETDHRTGLLIASVFPRDRVVDRQGPRGQ